MTRRSFFQQLVDSALEAASRALQGANNALDAVVPPPEQPVRPVTTPRRRPRTVRGRLNDLERENAFLKDQLVEYTGGPPQEMPPQRRLPTRRAPVTQYPRRRAGRLVAAQWTADHLRNRYPTLPAAMQYFDSLREASLPVGLLAVIQLGPTGPYDLFVGSS